MTSMRRAQTTIPIEQLPAERDRQGNAFLEGRKLCATSFRSTLFARRSLLACLIALCVALTWRSYGQPTLSRAEADSMQAKLARIEAAAEPPRSPQAPPLHTSFDERELNAYFAHYGSDFLPSGVATPRATLLEEGRIVARAMLDLDAFAYLPGSLEVVAAGAIVGAEGRGVIRFESATVGGVAVPKTLAQELLWFYTRSAERPQGFRFDEPFALPANIRAVSVERGSATITQ